MKLRLDATYSHLARLPKNDSQVIGYHELLLLQQRNSKFP